MTSASFNRPGAVDLSALKQKAQQHGLPARGPGAGRGLVRRRGHRAELRGRDHPPLGQAPGGRRALLAAGGHRSAAVRRPDRDRQRLRRPVPAGPAERGHRAGHRPGARAAGGADRDRPDQRAGRAAVPGGAAARAGPGGHRPAAQGGGGQRHRRPGRTGRRLAGRPTTSLRTSRWPTRGSRRPTRRWPAATSPRPRPSSTSCWRPTPATPRLRPGKAQAGLFARATRFDPQVVLAAARADDSVGVQLDAADVEMVSGQVEAAFDRLIGLIKTKSGRRAQPGPGPAAGAVRDGRERRPPGAQGAPRPDDGPVLTRGARPVGYGGPT